MRSSANSRTLTDAEIERLTLRSQTFIVAWSAILVSLFALSYSYSRGILLLYGDAVAHLHIARRILDSLTPGLRQLGSVWLPLPHLLLVPFVARMEWWRSGLAGAFPSMAAYVLGTAGIYRLARFWLQPGTALIAVLFFGLNPGLLYMQTTAMNEPLFLAEMIWAVVLIIEYARALEGDEAKRAAKLLIGAGLVLVAGIFTRYDGWIFTLLVWLVALRKMLQKKQWDSPAGGAFVLFTVMLAVAPLIWMGYSARQFGDPLDFLRGPYSARAIDARTTAPGSPHYPGWHSLRVAELYFLKAAELGAVPERFANLLLILSIAGSAAGAIRWRHKDGMTALLLWFPAPFYAYSIAYGSVPIFIPMWWPHSWYNTRYGMELLPIFALSLAFLVACATDWIARFKPSIVPWILAAAALLIVAGNVTLLRAKPLVLDEAIANSRTRISFEVAYARALETLPENSTILAYTSEHVGAFQRAGIALKRTINESDYYRWTPALADPAKAADFIVATDGDRVAQAVAARPDGLTLINIVCSTGQPCVRFYRSDRRAGSGSITQK
ncbi:MAG TPA: glycosyltransferase family 39 protein [Silvibacterium sp.]|nr:glycosyltransferase family 39 protein [Silvibacterium sp.]